MARPLNPGRAIRTGWLGVLVGDQDFPAGLGPAAGVVEATESADGADHVASSWNDAARVFHDLGETVTALRGALFGELQGTSVAVNGQAAAEVEFEGNARKGFPVQDGLVDALAFGMLANRAACLVADDG